MAHSAVQPQHVQQKQDFSAMDISSVTSAVPVSQTAVDNSQQTSKSNTADSSNAASAYTPPPPAPLPPGLGVRVDQLA